MPFERPTLQDIFDQIASDMQSRLDNVDPNLRRSFLNVLSRAFSGALHGHYGFLNYVSEQVFPDSAEAEFLRRWAKVWGIDPKPAWPATGTVTFTGTDGVTIPASTILQRGDGIRYQTSAEATIVGGSTAVAIEAEVGGETTNATNIVLNMIEPIAGINSTVAPAEAGLTGGSDQESDASLLNRLLKRIQQPPHGGAEHDYEAWALDQEAHGIAVTRAWVYPKELGLGTITVRFMMDDTYENGIPQAADLAVVKAHIESQRPVTADLFVPASIAQPLNFEISGLNPVSQTVKNAIKAELKDLIRREAIPGGSILISHIREAISIAAGEVDHVLVSPTQDVTVTTGQIITYGTMTWN